MDTQSLMAGFSWFDAVAVAFLVAGFIRGRKNGMSVELLPLIKWLAVLAAAGYGYRLAGDWMIPAVNPEWAYRFSYAAVAAVVGGALSAVQRSVGGKMVGSDVFGKSEFVLGMAAGMTRFACILILLFSFFNARVPTPEEISNLEKKGANEVGSVFLNPLQIQRAMVVESFTGRMIREYLGMVVIETTKGSQGPSDTMAKRQERLVASAMDASSTAPMPSGSASQTQGDSAPPRPSPAKLPKTNAAPAILTKPVVPNATPAKLATNTAAPAAPSESLFSSILRKLGFSGGKSPAPTNIADAAPKTNNPTAPQKVAPSTNAAILAKPVLPAAPNPAPADSTVKSVPTSAATNMTIVAPPAKPLSGAPDSVAAVPSGPPAPAQPPPGPAAPSNAVVKAAAPAPANAPAPQTTTAPSLTAPAPATVPSTNEAPVAGPAPKPAAATVLASTNGITISRSKAAKPANAPIRATNAPVLATNAPAQLP